MSDEERLLMEMIEMWHDGPDAVVESWQRYCADDVKWINCGMPDIVGLEACVKVLKAQERAWHYARIGADFRQVVAKPGCVVVERTDTMFDADGNEILGVDVVGVIEFRGDRISEWRDYFDPGAINALKDKLAAKPA